MATHYHPLDDSEQYEEFKIKKCGYNHIFNDFLHGKFDKNELMKRMVEAEEENLDDCALVDELRMMDLAGKTLKTVRHVIVE